MSGTDAGASPDRVPGTTGAPGAADPRVLVLGEALIDVVDRAGVVTAHPGGSPMNVAFGLATLGVPTAFATDLGDDEDGASIRSHLAGAGVTVLTGEPLARTSSARARIGADGGAAYEFDIAWGLTATDLPMPPVVHVGSIAAFLAPGAERVRSFLETLPEDTLLTFDPNVRADLLPGRAEALDVVDWYARHADVVKLSDEDAAWLFPDLDVSQVLDLLLARGVRLAVVTLGASGSAAASATARVQVPAPSVEVVDTIGAGDAYMTGMVHALLELADHDVFDASRIGQVCRTAAAVAAVNVGKLGAAGATHEELDAAMVRVTAAS